MFMCFTWPFFKTTAKWQYGTASTFIIKIYAWPSVTEVVCGFQVDFMKEAQHISEFAQYLERTGSTSIATCPFVYRAFSTQRQAISIPISLTTLTFLA